MIILNVSIYLALVASAVLAEREHKVHNIVLYPERHSWCTTTPIKQIVAMPGFESATIDNNVCVGACYSYSIPKTEPAEPGELIGPYCDSCQPVETQCYHVTLSADKKNADGPKTIQKRVQIIANCSCLSCSKLTAHRDCDIVDEHSVAALPSHMFSTQHASTQGASSSSAGAENVPELLSHQFPRPRPPPPTIYNTPLQTDEDRFKLNAKLIALLKSIQAEGDDATNLSYDKEQLEALLGIIEGSERALSDKNLMEFVNFVNVHNSEDFELDLSRLKDVLSTFQRQKLLEQHRQFSLGKLTPTVSAPTDTPLDAVQTHAQHHHHHAHGHHHGHVAGEEETVHGAHGHLVAGPHGSLVFAPDLKIEEKFNIDTDLLKPNHENVILSYENHPGYAPHHDRRK